MTRDELLKHITELDFYMIDLHLYLNTHPDDAEAIKMYNDCVMHAKELREEYNKSYGMILQNHCTSKVPWQWIDNPWPWQRSFNFDLTEEKS